MAKLSFQDAVSATAAGSLNGLASKPLNELRYKQFCDLLSMTVDAARANKYSLNVLRRMYYAGQLSLDWNKFSISDLEYRYWKANGQYTSGSINDMIRHSYSYWGTGAY